MKLFHAFGYALQGIKMSLKERNMKMHLLAVVIILAAGFFFSISATEWIAIWLCIGLVISTELLNTAIEELATAIASSYPDTYQKMGPPKDLGAGAVLVTAIISAIIGMIIFIPHLLGLIK